MSTPNTRRFDLSAVIPEPLTVTDSTGKVHDVKIPEMFGAYDITRIERMKVEIEFTYASLTTSAQAGDEAAIEQLTGTLEETIKDLIRIVAPTLPEVEIEKMTFIKRFTFVRWWSKEVAPVAVAKAESAGKAKAGTSTHRKQR